MTQRAVRQILIDAIQQIGADGLVNPSAECACLVCDLAPCDGIQLECRPGYRRMCQCGDWFLVADRNSKRDGCPICQET